VFKWASTEIENLDLLSPLQPIPFLPKSVSTRATQSKVILFYRDGTSDKTYEVWYEKNAQKYALYTAHGRRGGTLKKKLEETDLDITSAEIAMDVIVSGKKKKGYTENVSGVPFS
jgi:predicted DNA-binding WGR domain protein